MVASSFQFCSRINRGRWLPPPSNFVVELILYIINQVFLCKCIWN